MARKGMGTSTLFTKSYLNANWINPSRKYSFSIGYYCTEKGSKVEGRPPRIELVDRAGLNNFHIAASTTKSGHTRVDSAQRFPCGERELVHTAFASEYHLRLCLLNFLFAGFLFISTLMK